MSFVRSASTRSIVGDLLAQFHRYHGATPSPSEVASWEASLAAAAELLRPLQRYEVGVALAPGAADAGAGGPPGVLVEYHLPLSLKRIDLMLTGLDTASRPSALVLELKQWSEVSLEDDHATVCRVRGSEQVHPSRQALDYAEWLADYHGAFVDDAVRVDAAAWCHNLGAADAGPLRHERFRELLGRSPLFVRGEEEALREHARRRVGGGDGLAVLGRVTSAGFRPGPRVLDTLEAVVHGRAEWHLLDEQRLAFDAILDEVRRSVARRGRAVVAVRGAPGTGKTVIAVQLLAAASRLGWKAAHATGGKAFTTILRSKFKGADGLFIWNLHTRAAPYQGLDLLLVDEAHRVRRTSDTRYTPRAERASRSQARELIDAAKVTVFLLDENQSVRPDEVGRTALFEEEARACGARFKVFDLRAQFRCGGCAEYLAWVDHLLGFGPPVGASWAGRYEVSLVAAPAELDAMVAEAVARGESARLVAGFGWRWSDPRDDGSLAEDVQVGDWRRPWNRKPLDTKRYTPTTHPYTRWAETSEGLGQVGCVYSAQGFEFDRVGVLWPPDLVRRGDRWVAQKASSFDAPVRSSAEMEALVRNAYRVLLSRGVRETRLLVLDEETRAWVASCLPARGGCDA